LKPSIRRSGSRGKLTIKEINSWIMKTSIYIP
jgi:hypothetical protein